MSTESYSARGVYYFPGRVLCPLAGVGRRGPHDSNRLVLDDADTVVSIDRERRLIRVHNDRAYRDKHLIADFMFLASGTTASGGTTPFGIHLKIFKRGQKLSLDLHRHLRTSEDLTAAEFEPFEVVVTSGLHEEKVLDEQRVQALVRKPSWALRMVKSIMALRDNLGAPGKTGWAPDGRVADLRFEGGAGRVLLGDQSTELPGALDVARAYLEFHMLGGLLCDQVERRAAAAS